MTFYIRRRLNFVDNSQHFLRANIRLTIGIEFLARGLRRQVVTFAERGQVLKRDSLCTAHSELEFTIQDLTLNSSQFAQFRESQLILQW
jgi:hypothetical protein